MWYALTLLHIGCSIIPRKDRQDTPRVCTHLFVPLLHLTYSRPRSWLFPQIDAALHHGGAGTTSASLRGLQIVIVMMTNCQTDDEISGNPHFNQTMVR